MLNVALTGGIVFKIRFVKDRYFRIYVKHALDEVALYPLHNIENYLFFKNFEMIALFVTACRFCL